MEVQKTALEMFNEIEAQCDAEDKLKLSSLERLRFFCSLAMSGQDWLDVEPFFQAVEDNRLKSNV